MERKTGDWQFPQTGETVSLESAVARKQNAQNWCAFQGVIRLVYHLARQNTAPFASVGGVVLCGSGSVFQTAAAEENS